MLFLRQQKKPLDVIQKKDIYIPHTNKKTKYPEKRKETKKQRSAAVRHRGGQKGASNGDHRIFKSNKREKIQTTINV